MLDDELDEVDVVNIDDEIELVILVTQLPAEADDDDIIVDELDEMVS